METVKLLLGFLPGVTLGMWLRGMWLCIALCVCCPADECAWWVFAAAGANVVAASVAVAGDRERWRRVCDELED
jgi:hypothetical protein